MILNFFSKLSRILIKLLGWIIFLSLFVFLVIYGIDARKRWIEAPGCKWNVISGAENKNYSARFCYLTNDTVLLRIYDASGDCLLVERTYFEIGRVSIHWIDNKIIYDTTDHEIFDEGTVFLPPSMLDWLRARLP